MWPPVPPVAVVDGASAGVDDSADAGEKEEQEPSWEDWPVQAKLAMVLDHLRQNYHYCIFCGCQVCSGDNVVSQNAQQATSLSYNDSVFPALVPTG